MATRRDFLKSAAVAATTPVVIGATSCAPEAPAAGGTTSQTDSALQAELEEALARHKVVGASAAVFADGRVRTAASGLVNVSSGVEITPETVMHIGSITKVFNTTLLMQLVDEGLVDLSAPVSSYLPELRLRDPDHLARITVGMLVNHTSGIDGEMVPEQGHDEEIIEKAIPRFADMAKIHEPGADCSYCNTAHVISGYLAQKIRGRSWYDLMKERIFQPLEMEHAAVVPEDALLHRASVGHHTNPETGEPVRTSFAFLPVSFAPAGATAMMSASDLVTFAAAHMGDGTGPNGAPILSPQSARAMRTPTVRVRGVGSTLQFGLGWMLPADGFVSHGGGGPGILSVLTARPESNVAVAVLTNSDHGGALANELVNKWLEDVAGAAPPTPEVMPIVDVEVDVQRYAGTYENIALQHEVVEMDGGIGVSSWSKYRFYDNTPMEPSPPIALKPIGDDGFTFPDADGNATAGVLTFLDPNSDGRMSLIAQGARLVPRSQRG